MFYIHILERFLDLDLAVVNGQMSETQMSVYHEAQARIDKKVIFSKGKFEMNLRSGSEVGISDRRFISKGKFEMNLRSEIPMP